MCVCMCVSGEGGDSGVGQYWVVGAQGYVGMFPLLRNKFSFLFVWNANNQKLLLSQIKICNQNINKLIYVTNILFVMEWGGYISIFFCMLILQTLIGIADFTSIKYGY